MKKSLIPIGIAGLLALGATFASQTYIPATVEFQSAGGTDMTTALPDDVSKAMLSASAKDGNYYAGLSLLPDDPQPTPGAVNSLGIDVRGYYLDSNESGSKSRIDRTMKVTQNEKAVVYHISLTQLERTQTGQEWYQTTTDRDYVLALSRNGMFMKYNTWTVKKETNISSTSSLPVTGLGNLEQNLIDAVNANRGKWVYVGIFPNRMVEPGFDPTAMTSFDSQDYQRAAESYIDYTVMAMAGEMGSFLYTQFLSDLNANAKFLAQISSRINAGTYQQDGNIYHFQGSGTFDIDLTDKTRPIVNFKSSNGFGTGQQIEEQRIQLNHIDNEAVSAPTTAQLDFYDLLGGAIRNAFVSSEGGK